MPGFHRLRATRSRLPSCCFTGGSLPKHTHRPREAADHITGSAGEARYVQIFMVRSLRAGEVMRMKKKKILAPINYPMVLDDILMGASSGSFGKFEKSPAHAAFPSPLEEGLCSAGVKDAARTRFHVVMFGALLPFFQRVHVETAIPARSQKAETVSPRLFRRASIFAISWDTCIARTILA